MAETRTYFVITDDIDDAFDPGCALHDSLDDAIETLKEYREIATVTDSTKIFRIVVEELPNAKSN